MKPLLPAVLLDEKLPVRLSDLANPPKALFIRGELPRGPAVAIVGTRSPTPEGRTFARRLAADLASAGVAILSGGALGIDTEAHRGALQARGTTVVVAPAGFAKAYPPENEALFARVVARGGAYVALVEDDVSATRAAFFARNACLVALAWAVVVVQAGVRSGARNAAREARRLGRPLLAVPSAPWIGKGLGCLEELRLGARPCERANDVLDLLDAMGAQLIRPASMRRPSRSASRQAKRRAPTATELPPLDESALVHQVCELIANGAREVDQVADLAGLPVSTVNRVLLTLRLQGVLVSAASGQLSLLKSSD